MSRNSAYLLVVSVATLLVIGTVMLFSAGAYARDAHGDPFFFLKRQSVWLALGLVACVVAACVDYHWWARLCWPLLGLSVVLLALCFVPHVGMRINGSWRWVHLGPVQFQPSEVAKLAAIVFLAHWFARYERQSGKFLWGFFFPMMITAVPMLLIVREEDLGTTLLIGAVMVTMMFVAGANLFYMGTLAAAVAGGILVLATRMGNRHARLVAFMDLEKYKSTFGLQQWEGLQAFASGGVSGLGLGDSRAKMGYLPYAQVEFILPIIGEELGLRVTLLVVAAFLVIAVSGVLIALHARDRLGTLMAVGLTMALSFQAIVNIGVTTALLPNKGMPLPFISAGGSNLCLCLLFVGILLSIYRQGGMNTAAGRSRRDAAEPFGEENDRSPARARTGGGKVVAIPVRLAARPRGSRPGGTTAGG